MAFTVAIQSASAQGDEVNAARQLFRQGVDAVEQEDWEQGAYWFRRTLELRPSPAVAYNLAFALRHLGRFVEAMEHLQTVVSDPQAAGQVRRDAQVLLAEIEPLVGYLTVHVSGPERFDVTMNGNAYPGGQIGSEHAVDPGDHTLTLLVQGRELATASVHVGEADHAEVSLAPETPTPRMVAETDSERPPGLRPMDGAEEPIDEEPSVLTAWWFWTGVGVVAVGTVVAIVLIGSGGGTADPVGGNLDPSSLTLDVAP